MHKLIIVLKILLFSLYGFFSAVYTPAFLSLAFNFMKGIANNPEGVMFIPAGIIILLTITTIDILIIIKNFKSVNMRKPEKLLILSLFIVVKTIGLTYDQNGWKNFIHCFQYKFLK